MKVQTLTIENPEPIAFFFAQGMLHDYGTRDRYLRTGRGDTWAQISQRCPRYQRLGFDDGLILGMFEDAGDGRLLISGHTLWRLIFAGAMQREGLDTTSESVGRLFTGDDRKRVTHWVDEVYPRLVWPNRLPPADAETQRIVDGELRLRSSDWAEIRKMAAPESDYQLD
ncbi:hypothetical protein [Aquamicrobium defluvii]|uniref:Uncharacterized protein n=1 Tax=Aquamicrobium defluvii TaxID=69279 RepID=A0A4R6Y5A9_9HYPH|nr:hypothetical protein [Aquamicrobium defluvii]TDR30316.1 hypothetical protein DES43_1466 [Aquamicrobium defluvii]